MMIFGLAQAQPENFKLLSASEQKTAVSQITKTASALKTMQCKFVQEKKLSVLTNVEKSSGMMYYQTPKSLRWEFTQPKASVFIVHNDKVIMRSGNKTQQVSTAGSKMAKMMSEMVVGLITGTELSNQTNFKSTYYSDGKSVLVKLNPVKKELKKVYSSIEIYFNSKSHLATKIVMKESTGDVTTLNFSEMKKDVTLSEKLFQ